MALKILDPDFLVETTNGEDCTDDLLLIASGCESVRVGEKRPVHLPNVLNIKRQKVDKSEKFMPSLHSVKEVYYPHLKGKKEYAEKIGSSLLSFIEYLKPPGGKDNVAKPEISLTALSMLCIVFCKYPRAKISRQVYRQMVEWIPWISEQVMSFF